MKSTPVIGLFLGMVTFARSAKAQIDYRNLDGDRPALTEDAYTTERYAFAFLAPWRYSQSGGGNVHSFTPELEYGLLRNAHVGIKLPFAGAEAGGEREWGLSGLHVVGLYNINTESRQLPAFALGADVAFPVGSLVEGGTSVTLKGIATRSWGSTRLHMNGAYTLGGEDQVAAAEETYQWWVSGAVDQTLFRESLLLLAEVYARSALSDEPVEVNVFAGMRYQWTPTMVLDLGLGRRLKDVGPDIELTVGLTHAFAFPGLMPRRTR